MGELTLPFRTPQDSHAKLAAVALSLLDARRFSVGLGFRIIELCSVFLRCVTPFSDWAQVSSRNNGAILSQLDNENAK